MRRAGALLAIAFGCAALVAAQEPPTQTPPSSPQTAPRAGQSGTITVVGCLERGEASATGTTGGATAGTPPSRSTSGSGNSASFILANATPSASGSPGSTAGTTGTAGGATSGASSKTSYALEGSSSDLSASNIGKRVEVTGTLDTSSSGAPSAAGTTGGAMSQKKIKVSTVRVVGSDCSPEK